MDRLLKIVSKHFSEVEIETGAKFKDLQREHKDDNLFIDLSVIKDQNVPIKNLVDVILMDKVIAT